MKAVFNSSVLHERKKDVISYRDFERLTADKLTDYDGRLIAHQRAVIPGTSTGSYRKLG